jgi:hypothetical protein
MDAEFLVGSFSILIQRYELTAEQIDLVKNMLGKNALKFNPE